MNEFLSGYQAAQFTKIILKDGKNLKGYIPTSGSTSSLPSMTLQKKIDIAYFNVISTKKPIDTSLNDM